jgi:NAD+ synthase
MAAKTKYDERALRIDCEHVKQVLVGFLHDEVTKAGFRKAVIGLSGGVDSALSAALSAEALGADQVLGALLPYRSSSPDCVEDATAVAAQLGIRTVEIDITPMVDPYFERYEQDAGQVRRGNVMARMRMIVLYDISHKEKALVIGTSNRTELLLGYSTIWGDSACALNPLGDLLKTQVWQLAEYIGLPERVVKKTPSADLWQGQTDEGEMGIEYKTADRIITLLVDQRLPVERIVAHGFSRKQVDKVAEMIKRSQFKRLPPVIGKLGHRTVNRDFRYPRDWGL